MDADYIAKCGQIASVLEVSGHPSRVTCTEPGIFLTWPLDFLISGVVIGDNLRRAAHRGSRYHDPGKWHKIGLGKLIKDSVMETDRWVGTTPT